MAKPTPAELRWFYWDLWVMHGIEPHNDVKAEVQALGLSILPENKGTTLLELSHMDWRE